MDGIRRKSTVNCINNVYIFIVRSAELKNRKNVSTCKKKSCIKHFTMETEE